MFNRAQVYEALDSEREYQGRKWGHDYKSVPEYILFMEHHLAKARALATTQPGDGAALEEMRKVTALGVACLEDNGVTVRPADAPITFKTPDQVK